MKKTIPLLLFFLLFGAPAAPCQSPRDDQWSKKIVGTWEEGVSPFGVSIFRENGKYEATLYRSSRKKKALLSVRGTWKIEDGFLINKAIYIYPTTKIKPGDQTRDRIQEITEEHLILVDDKGRKNRKTRKK